MTQLYKYIWANIHLDCCLPRYNEHKTFKNMEMYIYNVVYNVNEC